MDVRYKRSTTHVQIDRYDARTRISWPNQIALERVPIPKAGAGEAVIRIMLTTICGTDVHILKGEYKVRPGLVIGHEAVGVIDPM